MSAIVFGPRPWILNNSSMDGVYLVSNSWWSGSLPDLRQFLDVGGHAFADAGDFQQLLDVFGESDTWREWPSRASAARR